MDSNYHTRVIGSMLSDNHGKNICLLGEVAEVDPNGQSFKVKTTDGKTVMIQTSEPIEDCIEGYVEVLGTVTPRNTITCSNYMQVPTDMTQDLDKEMYNETLQLIAQNENFYVPT